MFLSDRILQVLDEESSSHALQFEDDSFTWGEIGARSNQIERVLQDCGIDVDTPIALVFRNTPNCVAAFVGLCSRDRCALSVSPIQPQNALAKDILNLKPAVIIAEERDWCPSLLDAARELGSVGIRLPNVSASGNAIVLADASEIGEGPFFQRPEDAGIVIPTSGTTGIPKRISMTRKQLLKYVPKKVKPTTPDARKTIVIAAPLVTITGLGPLLSWIARPLNLALMERLDIHKWADLIAKYKIKLGGLPPAAMRMILNADIDPKKLSSLTGWVTGSAPLDPALADAFEDKFNVPVLTAYGATEFGGAVAAWTIEDRQKFGKSKRGSSGRALPNYALRIVDPETGSTLPDGASGLLAVKHLQPSSNSIEEWITTNDLAHLDEDGFLYIEGRADDVIIRGGFKIPLLEIERTLTQNPSVKQAAVIGIPDERLGSVPAAAVVLKKIDSPCTEGELISWLKEKIAPYKIPVIVKLLPELPMTASMKVVRHRLSGMLTQELNKRLENEDV